jgi:hypothetical protein
MANWGHAACMSPEIDSCSSQWNIDVFSVKKSPATVPGFSSSGYGFRLLERTMSVLRGYRDRREIFVEQPQVLDRLLELHVGLSAQGLIAIELVHIHVAALQ